MTIIRLNQKQKQRVQDNQDPWTYLTESSTEQADKQDLQDHTQDYLIVPWTSWQKHAESFSSIKHLAIHFPNDGDLTLLADELNACQMIVLDFPAFTDGRSYSIASSLKQEYHYQGELRARGDIGINQIHLMWRCGFDSLEIPDAELATRIINTPLPFTAFYQSALRGGRPVYKDRLSV